jgi:hypothetical protein
VDLRHFECLIRRKLRQQAGQPGSEHRLASTSWADHQKMVTSGSGNFQRLAAERLAPDFA